MTNKRSFTCLGFLIVAAFSFKPAYAGDADRVQAETRFSQGLQAFQAERYQDARKELQACVDSDPDFAAGHYLLGLTLLQIAPGVDNPAQRDGLLQRASAEFKLSRAQDPELIVASLNDALVETMLGRYGDADSRFNAYIQERPDDPLPYLFMAVMYYRLGKSDQSQLDKASENLDKAQQALAASAKPDPTLQGNIELYRALIELQQNRVFDAEKRLKNIREIAPESTVEQQANDLLKKIKEDRFGVRPFDLSIQAGFDWDSNVDMRGKNTPPVRFFRHPHDESWRFGISSAFTYRIAQTDEMVIGAGLDTYNSWHTDMDEYDVQDYDANIFAGLTPQSAQWLTLGVRFDVDQTLLGNDSYLLRSRFTPQIDIRESDRATTTLYYQLDSQDYHYPIPTSDLDQDGLTHSFGTVQEFAILDLFGRPLTTSFSYRFEDVGTEGREFDADNHVFGLFIDVPLPEDFSIDVTNEWELQYYRNPSLYDSDRSKRRDLIYTLGFGLTKRFNENLSARLGVEVTKDDSNVRSTDGAEFFSYDRVIYGLTVTYRF